MTTQSKSFKEKLIHEIKSVAIATVYFAIWFGVLMFLKTMILAEYKIEFSGILMVLIGALVLGKVVLVVDHIPLAHWTRNHAAIYFVIFRTLFSILGVFIVLLLEHAFKSRHEYGSFGSAIINAFEHRDIYHLWASVTVVTISVFWFNVLFVVQQHLGDQKLGQLFFSTPMKDITSKSE